MLLLIENFFFRHFWVEHSNTSHVTINPPATSGAILDLLHSNTSHVTINPFWCQKVLPLV